MAICQIYRCEQFGAIQRGKGAPAALRQDFRFHIEAVQRLVASAVGNLAPLPYVVPAPILALHPLLGGKLREVVRHLLLSARGEVAVAGAGLQNPQVGRKRVFRSIHAHEKEHTLVLVLAGLAHLAIPDWAPARRALRRVDSPASTVPHVVIDGLRPVARVDARRADLVRPTVRARPVAKQYGVEGSPRPGIQRVALHDVIGKRPRLHAEAPSHDLKLDPVVLHVHAGCEHAHASRHERSPVLAAPGHGTGVNLLPGLFPCLGESGIDENLQCGSVAHLGTSGSREPLADDHSPRRSTERRRQRVDAVALDAALGMLVHPSASRKNGALAVLLDDAAVHPADVPGAERIDARVAIPEEAMFATRAAPFEILVLAALRARHLPPGLRRSRVGRGDARAVRDRRGRSDQLLRPLSTAG